MNSSKVKTLVIVFALLVLTSIITVGCKQRGVSGGLMNTDTLPGKSYLKGQKRQNPNIVYLGSDSTSIDDNFGPKDISFEFQALR